MNLTADDVDNLKRAFPNEQDGETLRHLCAWCGKTRRRQDALCRSCWLHLPEPARVEYIGLGLGGRARWIVERIPKVRA